MLTCDDCGQSFEPENGCVCGDCRDALSTRVLGEVEAANDALRTMVEIWREEAMDLVYEVERLFETLHDLEEDEDAPCRDLADVSRRSILIRIEAIKALQRKTP